MASANTYELLIQTDASRPAKTEGACWIVRVILSGTEIVQGETAAAVSVKVAVPAAISADPGV